MTQYIEKSALVAEINKRLHQLTDSAFDSMIGRNLIEIRDSLDTLEVKEEDENEYINKYFKGWYVDLTDQGNILHTPDGNAGLMSVKEVARHFFELGMQAQFDKELVEEVYSHIDSIKDTADRMTSGNFMHNRAAIKFSANTIAKVLELMGLKVAQKGE